MGEMMMRISPHPPTPAGAKDTNKKKKKKNVRGGKKAAVRRERAARRRESIHRGRGICVCGGQGVK